MTLPNAKSVKSRQELLCPGDEGRSPSLNQFRTQLPYAIAKQKACAYGVPGRPFVFSSFWHPCNFIKSSFWGIIFQVLAPFQTEWRMKTLNSFIKPDGTSGWTGHLSIRTPDFYFYFFQLPIPGNEVNGNRGTTALYLFPDLSGTRESLLFLYHSEWNAQVGDNSWNA